MGFRNSHHKSKQIWFFSTIMLILKYYKPISSFPNLTGPLSEKISSKAANAEVEKIHT